MNLDESEGPATEGHKANDHQKTSSRFDGATKSNFSKCYKSVVIQAKMKLSRGSVHPGPLFLGVEAQSLETYVGRSSMQAEQSTA